MPKHGKNFRKALEGVNLQERLSVEDAVSKSLGASFAKFDETVDVAIRLGVDPKYSDQMVRGAVTLPHGLGKTVRVAVFCKGEKPAPTSWVLKTWWPRSRKAGWTSTPPSPPLTSWLWWARSAVCSAPAA